MTVEAQQQDVAAAPVVEVVATAPADEVKTPDEQAQFVQDLILGIADEPADDAPVEKLPADAASVDAKLTEQVAPVAQAPTDVEYIEPDGLSERSKTRWNTLAERAKQVPELAAKVGELTEQVNNVRGMVNESGLDAGEFTNLLSLGKLYKSQNTEDMKQAIAQLDDLRADLAMRSGVEVAGLDPLKKYPDLLEEVDDMTLTRQRALEIAKARAMQEQGQRVTQQSQEHSAFAQKQQTAATQMDAALAARAGTAGHDAKIGFIKSYLANPEKLTNFVKTYQPDQWQAAVMMMYDSYNPPITVAASVQPLRSAGVQSGTMSKSGATTPEESVQNAFKAVYG